MAIPKITDGPGMTVATFTRGEAFPFAYMPYKALQERDDLPGGDVYVRDESIKKRYFRILVENESFSVAEDVAAVFDSTAADYAGGVFKYYPDYTSGTNITCRLIEPFIKIMQQQNAPELYSIEINCREE